MSGMNPIPPSEILQQSFTCFSLVSVFFFFPHLLGIEPRTSHMLGKCSTTELHASPSYSLYDPCVAMATLLVNGSSSCFSGDEHRCSTMLTQHTLAQASQFHVGCVECVGRALVQWLLLAIDHDGAALL